MVKLLCGVKHTMGDYIANNSGISIFLVLAHSTHYRDHRMASVTVTPVKNIGLT